MEGLKLPHRLVITSVVYIAVIAFVAAKVARRVDGYWVRTTILLIVVGAGGMALLLWYSLPEDRGGRR